MRTGSAKADGRNLALVQVSSAQLSSAAGNVRRACGGVTAARGAEHLRQARAARTPRALLNPRARWPARRARIAVGALRTEATAALEAGAIGAARTDRLGVRNVLLWLGLTGGSSRRLARLDRRRILGRRRTTARQHQPKHGESQSSQQRKTNGADAHDEAFVYGHSSPG